MSFSPNGHYLAIGEKEKVHIFDWNSKQKIKEGETCQRARYKYTSTQLFWTPDSKFVAGRWKKTCRLFSAETGDGHKTKPDFEYRLGENVHSIAFSENGKYLALGANNVSAIYDRESGHLLKACDAGAYDVMRKQKIV